MCRSFSKQKFIHVFVFVACSMFSTSYITAINWVGGDIDCADSNIDQNFSITNVNNVVGPVLVQSISVDVAISIGANAVLKSDDTTAGRIFISAAAGRTVTFNILANDLKFRGSDNNQIPLLIAFSGAGTLVFNLGDNRIVSFTSDATTEGARFYVCMDPVSQPTVRVQRNNTNSSSNVEFVVGNKSCVTYVATPMDSTGVGTIQFVPDNANPNGFLILRIQDSSCFVIEGQEATKTPEQCTGPGDVPLNFLGFTLSDVNLTLLRGAAAIFSVVSPTGTNQGALRIINGNQRLTPLRIDPFCDNAFIDADGQRWGFILGANGQVLTADSSYIDYIGTGTNACPRNCPPSSCLCGAAPEQVIKERNPSAFWVDGIADESFIASIQMSGSSGIYFRSGSDKCGNVNEADGFIINPDETVFEEVKTPGAGSIVFDVEGQVNVVGASPNSNALQILSLEVTTTGCPIIIASEATDPTNTVFPARTFAENALEDYLRYNSAAFLINNFMNVQTASIVHTDQNHNVYERDNLGRPHVHSEPTYVGGEGSKIECNGQPRPRPAILLENSIFRVHTNVGFTGVDLIVPNIDDPAGNESVLRFYNNGCTIDKTYGRVLILGTMEGSLSCGGTLVDHDSHLDVVQIFDQSPANADAPQTLELQTANNDACITEGLGTVFGNAVHTIFLGGASNISVGTNTSVSGLPTPITSPQLLVNGSFLSFETAGGTMGYPEASGTTGEGGIFVDQNGNFGVVGSRRVNISAMVVKSGNGTVNLPVNQVYFHNRIGITKWQVDLANPDDRIIIGINENLSDFTFDWGAAIRDCGNFIPYELEDTPSVCRCPPIIEANLTGIPVVQGTVEQLQIKRSRLGDMVHLMVDGGHVKELVMLTGFNTAEAPMGLIAVDNNGQVGLGTAHRNIDSLEATVKLGINGITLVAKGDGVVELNEDIIIDNVCHIMTSTDFGATTQQTLVIHSMDEKEFRVKSTGFLDLSDFNTPNKVIQFAGAVRVIFEPGSQLILGSPLSGQRGVLVFTDLAEMRFDRLLDSSLADRVTAEELQPILVKISGIGDIVFEEGSHAFIHQQNFVAIQSHPVCAPATDIQIILNDQGRFEIGNDIAPGGSLQVGNTTNIEGNSVGFGLIVNGAKAKFEINREGALLAGAAIASKLPSVAPNDWRVESALNLSRFQITVNEGVFTHNQIYPGSSLLASLIVIGSEASNAYGFTYDRINALIRGGGNLFSIPAITSNSLLQARNKAKTNKSMIAIQRGNELILNHFSAIPVEHAPAIQISLQPGAIINGAQGKIRLQVNGRKSLALNGRELVRMHKLFEAMDKKQTNLMRNQKSQKMVCIAPYDTLPITRGLEVKNDTNKTLFLSKEDVAMLTSYLIGNNALHRQISVNPTVEDTASAQANLMQSKDMFDQRPILVGLVSPTAYFNYLQHINTNDYSSPIASLAPFGPVQSRVGYIEQNTSIIRKPVSKIINGIAGDPTDHQISQTRGAAYHHRHIITGSSYTFIEIPHLQPGIGV